jgi:hypothetical protein
MSSTQSIPEEAPGARAGATATDCIPKTLGRGLRIWWAFYWRKSLVFAIFVTALLLTVNPLYERGAIPFWLFHYLLEFGPYAINYAVALPAIHFVLKKKFRDFRIGLVATETGTGAEVLQPAFARAFRIWWTYSWRTFAYCIGIYFVVSIPLGLLVGTLGTIFPRWNDAFAYSAGLAIEGAAGLFVIYSNILDEDFSDFRVCLLPRVSAVPDSPAPLSGSRFLH